MTAMAVWAKEAGYQVSGSDVSDTFPTDKVLQEVGIVPFLSFSPVHCSKADLIIYTGAHSGIDNLEVQQGIRLGVPVLPHGKALGEITKDKKVIAVAGCHGKTTTAAMIATVLLKSGIDCSYTIGSGLINGLGLPGHAGKSEYFVVEADEYVTDPLHDKTPRFLWLNPTILVITTIDYDHPDVYADIHAVGLTYQGLVNNMKDESLLIWNSEDIHSQTYLSGIKQQSKTYGFRNADITIQLPPTPSKDHAFTINDTGKTQELSLSVPGNHNAFNAAAAYAVATHLSVSFSDIQAGLLAFGGCARRFEIVGTKDGVCIVDDYAHHPTEIKATLQASKSRFPEGRIVCIFQPHTFSRTEAFINDFSQAFTNADVVYITDIYASAREKKGTMTGSIVTEKIAHYHSRVSYVPSKEELFSILKRLTQPNDVLIFMGAGDIGLWGLEYLES